jgi:hypothetical protein
VPPDALSKTCLTGTSSKVLQLDTTLALPNDILLPHTILNANRADPSIWFHFVAVVVKAPSAYFGVSIVYITESVAESRIVAFRMSSSVKAKDKSMLRRALGSGRRDVCGKSYHLNDK